MNEQDKMNAQTIQYGEDKLRGVLSEAEKKLRKGQEQVSKIASDLDKRAKENPWPLVAGIGVFALMLGVIIGKSKD